MAGRGGGMGGRRYSVPIVWIATVNKYLGLLLTVTDNDWPSVIFNLHMEQKNWSCLYRIL